MMHLIGAVKRDVLKLEGATQSEVFGGKFGGKKALGADLGALHLLLFSAIVWHLKNITY